MLHTKTGKKESYEAVYLGEDKKLEDFKSPIDITNKLLEIINKTKLDLNPIALRLAIQGQISKTLNLIKVLPKEKEI